MRTLSKLIRIGLSRRLGILVILAGIVLAVQISPAGIVVGARIPESTPLTVEPTFDETAVEVAAVPRPGGLSTTLSSTNSVGTLIASIPFRATSLGTFDISSQRWATYIPGASHAVNRRFVDQLRADVVVWVRRDPLDRREGLVWALPAPARGLSSPQALVSPAEGDLTVGPAGTPSVTALIEAQDFEVSTVLVFNVTSQEYLSYIPGAPAHANTLAINGLEPTSVVWLRRGGQDAPAPPAAGDRSGTPIPSGPTVAAAPTAAPTAATTQVPAAPASAGDASLLRAVTYEAGTFSDHGMQTSANGLGVTGEAARTGSSAGYAILRPEDPRWSGGGFRAEWHGDDHISGPGTERWHGISYYFPSDYNQGTNSTWNDRIVFQFADEGSPMFSLHLDARTQELWVRRKLPERDSGGNPQFEELARWKFSTERWYDVAFHIRWTRDGSGVFEVYVDDVKKVAYEGRTLGERDVTYSKWGIYGQPTKLFFDDVRILEGADGLSLVNP